MNTGHISQASSARLVLGAGNKPVSRREAMRCGLLGTAGMLLADRFAASASAAVRPATAKSVIQIWLWGGPTHLDTFDPKPDAGNDYCGPLDKPIATNVDGIAIGELLPVLAKQADKYLDHPQHDPRQQRPRDGRLHGPDGPERGRAAASIRAWAPWSRCSKAMTPATAD